MGYRDNARVACAGCPGVVAERDGELSKNGELVCRMCANVQRIRDADACIARGRGSPRHSATAFIFICGVWFLQCLGQLAFG